MGEAKRRKQSDPTYGKVPLLRTERDQQKTFKKITNDLFSECSLELRTLASLDKASHKEYLRVCERLDSWFKNRLSNYHEQDREAIANSLVIFMYKMLEKHDINPLLYVSFINILKSYISPELREKLSEGIKSLATEFGSV